jgi:alginate O-acetyltransferase complex protein AlgI
VLGLFEKCVLADSIFAPVADAFFNAPLHVGANAAWCGVLAFSGQIFCDFAGYSTCAIGTALAFGFTLPVNFCFPYAALGFSDFWRRWHISLSSWLRDYLYVSLGGNRAGEWRTYRNLLLTMLIGGLWHGAAWTFVIWGGLHGLYLAAERFVRDRVGSRAGQAPGFLRVGYMLLTLLLVVLAWTFFRAPDASTALHILALLWPATGTAPLGAEQKLALLAFAGVVVTQWVLRDSNVKELGMRIPAPALGLALGMLLAAIVLSPGDSHAFIYFQF